MKKKEFFAPKEIAKVAIATILTIAITIMVTVLLNRNNFSKNFDFTTNKINSLSDETKQFLGSLNTDVQIICIPGQKITDNYCDSNADIIKLYEKENSHIINLGTLDLRDSALVSRVQPSGFSQLILITTTNRSEISGSIDESKLTNALLNLVKFKKIVYFLTGHGEPEITASNTAVNYSEVVSLLESRAYTVQTIHSNESIPNDARVLVAGDNLIPYDSYTESEITKFVARGGKLILIVNPYRTQGLSHFYEILGVKPENILLTLNKTTTLGKQLAKQNLSRPPVVMGDFNTESPITNIIAQAYGAQANIPIDGAQPFTILEKKNSPVKTDILVLMSAVQAAPITLTDAQRNKINLQTPFTLNPDKNFDADISWPIGFDIQISNASALSKDVQKSEDDTSEVVLYGFSLANIYSTEIRVTEELLLVTVAQLYQDKELLSVPKKDFTPKQFNYSRNPGAWVFLFAGFLPVCTALTGLFIWIWRRRA